MQATSSTLPATESTVSWDYPPSYDALLSRGASHSRFLRLAYSSTRERSPPSPPQLTPYPLLSRSCVHVRPRSANPMSHTLKRRKSHWPKPPHYHASLLRSPLSHRKGLFRAVLPPNKAADFFRWDVLLGARVSLSASSQERDRARSSHVDASVVESVLEPYEAAAGFFGWHGLGLDVIRRDHECCWSEGASKCKSSNLQLEIDEAAVEQGRARWARSAEELVGPSGPALRRVVENGKSGKVTSPSDPAHKGVVDASSISSRREEVRWDPDSRSSPFRPSGAASASDEKRQSPPSGSKPELKPDSPSACWYAPPPHRGPPPTPHLPSLRFLPPPPVQYGHPSLQFSPWFPAGRVASAQGHGYWYGAQTMGAPSPMTRDPNLAKPLPSHSHVFATPVTPTSIHPVQSPRYPTKSNVGRDEYAPGHDCDKETETDYGYESTTTTTDSDPLPHTPVGAVTTSHCVETRKLHGDDEVEVYGVEIDEEHAAASVTISLSDPTTPVKLLGRFSMSASSSVSSGSPDSNRDGCESSKAAVVFPSLNGSFCQGSLSQMSVSLLSPGMSTQTTPVRTVTPLSSSSLSSPKESTTQLGPGDEEDSEIKLMTTGLEASACSVSGDSPAVSLSLCSPPPTSPSPGLRKDSQGFWEPMRPVSPSSSSSSPPLSPSEGKMGSRPTAGWIGERTRPVPGESSESPEAASPSSTLSTKSRSLSPSPRRVSSAGSTRSSSSRPASFSSPTSTPASGSVFGSYPCTPSPPNGSSFVPANPTTLLPAFLATSTVKRKKTSRTREIVDRLRSSSIDAGKGGVGSDSLGWLASPGAGGELDGKLGKASPGSDHAAGNHVAGGQPSQSGADSALRVGSDLGKNHSQAPGSKPSDSGSSGSGGKSSGATQAAVLGSENLFSHAAPRTVTTTANPSITPFPILSVSQKPVSNFAVARQSQTGGPTGREPVIATPSKSADVSKMNATVATSPNARSSGPQLVPITPNGGTSPSARPSHHPLPLPPHPTVHPHPPLGPPPPMLAVPPYPHPVYVPFAQYHLAPPQQGQGTWMAVYPGRPPHLPVHALPAPTHIAPITGVSGMRHVSW